MNEQSEQLGLDQLLKILLKNSKFCKEVDPEIRLITLNLSVIQKQFYK